MNRRYRLIAIAVGPPRPPNRLEVLANVVVLGPAGAVEIPGADGQPSWLLFEIDESEERGRDVATAVGVLGPGKRPTR